MIVTVAVKEIVTPCVKLIRFTQVVWVTATAPYVILFIFFIRGAMLEGAREGLVYFIKPNMTRYANGYRKPAVTPFVKRCTWCDDLAQKQ